MGWKYELDSFVVSTQILGAIAQAKASVKLNWLVEIDLQWSGSTYSFIITHFMSQGQAESIHLFFKDTKRDALEFGFIDGCNGNLNVTAQQKRNIIRKCCQDLVKTLELIINHHQRSLIDYSVWYRDKRPVGKRRNTYPEFITIMACDCIIQGEILGFNGWKVIEFL